MLARQNRYSRNMTGAKCGSQAADESSIIRRRRALISLIVLSHSKVGPNSRFLQNRSTPCNLELENHLLGMDLALEDYVKFVTLTNGELSVDGTIKIDVAEAKALRARRALHRCARTAQP